MTERTDIAIIGAGPIGLATALAASPSDHTIALYERNSETDRPSCCTGLVSPKTLDVLGVSSDCVHREIRAVCLHLPSGRTMDLRSEKTKALVIDRAALSAELVRRVRDAGGDVFYRHAAISTGPSGIEIASPNGRKCVRSSVLIGADGPHSAMAQWYGMPPPTDVVSAIQVEMENLPCVEDGVDVYVGADTAPGFFAWKVPAEDGIARVGLGVLAPHSPGPFLDRFLERHCSEGKERTRSAGHIPLDMPSRIAKENVLLVGDAAGQTKPLSGGGLYTGGLCARFAGETARHIVEGAPSEEAGAHYRANCLDAIGKELAFGQSIRGQLAALSDEAIDSAAASLDDPHFLQVLADHADIDAFHRLPDQLAATPSLWSTLLRAIPFLLPPRHASN